MKDPYSDCIENTNQLEYAKTNEYVDYTFKVSKSYTQASCLNVCYQKFIMDEYKCYDSFMPYLPTPENYPPCPLIIDSYNTAFYEKELFYNKSMDEFCLKKCPTECQYVIYKTTASTIQFPTLSYIDALAYKKNSMEKFKDVNTIKDGILGVNVFFNSEMFALIREKPALEFESFISDSGGMIEKIIYCLCV
jgi:hypothetical protein